MNNGHRWCLYSGAAVEFAYLDSFIFDSVNTVTAELLNDSVVFFPFLSLGLYFPSNSLFAIVEDILKVILVVEIELVDFACRVRKHLNFEEEDFILVYFFSFFFDSPFVVRNQCKGNQFLSEFSSRFFVIRTQ